MPTLAEGNRLRRRLTQVQPSIDEHTGRRDTGGQRPTGAFCQEGRHLANKVTVRGLRVGHPGSQSDVGGHHARPGGRRQLKVIPVGKAARCRCR